MRPDIVFYDSLNNHQIKPRHGFALRGTLVQFDRGEFQKDIRLPKVGVLHVQEQGVDLSFITATFHEQRPDGSLGPPWTVRRPIFVVAS